MCTHSVGSILLSLLSRVYGVSMECGNSMLQLRADAVWDIAMLQVFKGGKGNLARPLGEPHGNYADPYLSQGGKIMVNAETTKRIGILVLYHLCNICDSAS